MLYNEKQLIAFGKFILDNQNQLEGNLQDVTDAQLFNWKYSEGFDFVASYEPTQKVFIQYFDSMPPVPGTINKVHVFEGHNRYDIDAILPNGDGERFYNIHKRHIYKHDHIKMVEYFEKIGIALPV